MHDEQLRRIRSAEPQHGRTGIKLRENPAMLTARPASDCRENGAGIQLSGIARLEGSSPPSLRPSTRSSRPPALLPTASPSSQSPLLSLRHYFPSIRPRHGLPRRPRLLPRLRSPLLRGRDGERVPMRAREKRRSSSSDEDEREREYYK